MQLRLRSLATLAFVPALFFSPKPAQAEQCKQFGFQEEAQLLLSQGSGRFSSLDSNGNGLACENLPSIGSLTDDPWSLPETLLLGDKATTLASYYENVVIAGDTLKVQAFLEYHDLTTQWLPSYFTSRPLWGACTEIRGPGSTRGSQAVCVAVDEQRRILDNRIFSQDYANQVALEIFNWY